MTLGFLCRENVLTYLKYWAEYGKKGVKITKQMYLLTNIFLIVTIWPSYASISLKKQRKGVLHAVFD